jgi:hypothetical protein
MSECPEVIPRGGNKIELALFVASSILLVIFAVLIPKIVRKKKLQKKQLLLMRITLIAVAFLALLSGVYRFNLNNNDDTYLERNYKAYIENSEKSCVGSSCEF